MTKLDHTTIKGVTMDEMRGRAQIALDMVLAQHPDHEGIYTEYPEPSITVWDKNDPDRCETFRIREA